MASEEVASLCRSKMLREGEEIKNWLAKNPDSSLIVKGYERGAGFNLRQVNQHNHQTSRERLADITEALKRIKDKIFGVCVDCGREIPEDRLLVYPYAKRCISCQKALSEKKKNLIH